MAKSFLLRNQGGEICGYLVQKEGFLCCRADCPHEGAALYVSADSGAVDRFEFPAEAGECSWEYAKNAESAYVCVHDRLAMDTGGHARIAYRKSAVSADGEKKASVQKMKGDSEQELQDAAVSFNENRTFPQRRWPPPVLIDCARYRDGRWIDQNIELQK